MKKIWKTIAAAMIPFLLLVTASACKSTAEAGIRQDETAGQVRMGQDVLKAIETDDYTSFRRLCGDLIPQEDFELARKNMTRQFGEITGYRHLVSLRTPVVQNDVWQVTFRRKTADGREIVQDLLFRFVTGVENDTRRIIGLAFL